MAVKVPRTKEEEKGFPVGRQGYTSTAAVFEFLESTQTWHVMVRFCARHGKLSPSFSRSRLEHSRERKRETTSTATDRFKTDPCSTIARGARA